MDQSGDSVSTADRSLSSDADLYDSQGSLADEIYYDDDDDGEDHDDHHGVDQQDYDNEDDGNGEQGHDARAAGGAIDRAFQDRLSTIEDGLLAYYQLLQSHRLSSQQPTLQQRIQQLELQQQQQRIQQLLVASIERASRREPSSMFEYQPANTTHVNGDEARHTAASLSPDQLEAFMRTMYSRTIIKQPCSPYATASCSYGHKNGVGAIRMAFGMTVQRLSAAVMESLINCGWARSGMWLYRPTNSRTCCPNYAIRLPVMEFRISNSQKKVLQKWRQLLAGAPLKLRRYSKYSKYPPRPAAGDSGVSYQIADDEEDYDLLPSLEDELYFARDRRGSSDETLHSSAQSEELEQHQQHESLLHAAIAGFVRSPSNDTFQTPSSSAASSVSLSGFSSTRATVASDCSQTPDCAPSNDAEPRIAIFVDLCSILHQLINEPPPRAPFTSIPGAAVLDTLASLNESVVRPQKRTLQHRFGQWTSDICLRLFKPCKALSPGDIVTIAQELVARFEEHLRHRSQSQEISVCVSAPGFLNFRISNEHQQQQQRQPSRRQTPASITREPRRPRELSITMESPTFTSEKHDLWVRYLLEIHELQPTDALLQQLEFSNFFCRSPTVRSEGPECFEYGTYHRMYRLDGVLIAAALVTILPSYWVSEYVMWDPEYRHYSIGKFTALHEIELLQQHIARYPNTTLRYYNMVFYVPNCSNMQYLGSFSPSELLCPVTHVWVPLEQCRPLLRESLFCRFAPRVDGGELLREWEDDPTPDATPEEAQAVSNAIIHHRSMFYFLSEFETFAHHAPQLRQNLTKLCKLTSTDFIGQTLFIDAL